MVLKVLMVLMTTMIMIHDDHHCQDDHDDYHYNYNGKLHDGGLMIHDA